MASAFITRRRTSGGTSYVVRYRLGGRAYPIVHGGAFDKLELAKTRRGLIAGELAAGRDPAIALRAMLERPPVRTFAQWAERYQASRVDYAHETTRGVTSHVNSMRMFNDRDPASLTFADVQEWIAGLDLKPSSLRRYVATLRLLLDFAGVDPNPARDRRVKLPRLVREEPNPPTFRQFGAILNAVPRRWQLPFVFMEQTGMEPGATELLEVGDLDILGCQLRLRRQTVKGSTGARARWVQVPPELMEAIDSTLPPLEDREGTKRVFPGFTPNSARHAMMRACTIAKVPHFHPYDLRHRRLSLWHGQGIPAKELATRAGHVKPSMTLDVYSHVLIDMTDPTADEWLSWCGLREA